MECQKRQNDEFPLHSDTSQCSQTLMSKKPDNDIEFDSCLTCLCLYTILCELSASQAKACKAVTKMCCANPIATGLGRNISLQHFSLCNHHARAPEH